MNRNPSRGFTLVEMLIVIAILGIVLGIAAPNLSRYRHNVNLREAARDISAEMNLCRQRAITENSRYRISFDFHGRTYTVSRLPDGAAAWQDLSTGSLGGGNALISFSSTTFSESPPASTFLPRGTAVAGGALVIEHSKSPRRATITLNITGRVRVDYSG